MSHVAYFSHSWKHEDSPLNLAIWARLAKSCRLLIDEPPIELGKTNPPYYISRIESLLRRSDLFVGCLPSLPEPKWKQPPPDAQGDWRYSKFSPYILFEIRLAERAGVPRLIIYDLESGFLPPSLVPPHSRYLSVRFSEIRKTLEKGGEIPAFNSEIDSWIESARHYIRPDVEIGGLIAGILHSHDASRSRNVEAIRKALIHAGIHEIIPISASFSTDAELSEKFRCMNLLVADLDEPDAQMVYSTAHAQLVPAIRLFGTGGRESLDRLPPLLRGHPAGYQEDLLPGSIDDEVLAAISSRAEATIKSGASIDDHASGRRLIQQRGYRPHFVFLSHASKQDDRMANDYRREMVDAILRACGDLGINIWEYDTRNRSGENWKRDMMDALERMTHFVPLITDNYRFRDNCKLEVEVANKRFSQGEVVQLPFLIGGNTMACAELADQTGTQKRLSEVLSFEEKAEIVSKSILRSIIR